jgi:hypothetical protein
LVERLITGIEAETLDADGAVARQTNLDRRTVKKYVAQGLALDPTQARA